MWRSHWGHGTPDAPPGESRSGHVRTIPGHNPAEFPHDNTSGPSPDLDSKRLLSDPDGASYRDHSAAFDCTPITRASGFGVEMNTVGATSWAMGNADGNAGNGQRKEQRGAHLDVHAHAHEHERESGLVAAAGEGKVRSYQGVKDDVREICQGKMLLGLISAEEVRRVAWLGVARGGVRRDGATAWSSGPVGPVYITRGPRKHALTHTRMYARSTH